jgi:uncharacterized protein YkwD
MPVKTKKIHHYNGHDKHSHKRNKRFLKVYAPYIPLLLIVSTGLFLSFHSEIRSHAKNVLSYATNTTDDGLLQATNDERAKNSLPALQFNTRLDTAAQAKANDMAKRNYWSHVTPDGQEPWVFITNAGYKYVRAEENLAYGFDSSVSTLSGWMNSPAHRENILDKDITEVGFGIVNTPSYQGHGPETIVVAMYGKPAPAETTVAVIKPPSNPSSTLPAQTEKKISYAQVLTGGQAPWLSLAIGLLVGAVATFLFIRHTRRLHKMMRSGERFVLHHPLLDITLVAFLALAAIVGQTVGTIH